MWASTDGPADNDDDDPRITWIVGTLLATLFAYVGWFFFHLFFSSCVQYSTRVLYSSFFFLSTMSAALHRDYFDDEDDEDDPFMDDTASDLDSDDLALPSPRRPHSRPPSTAFSGSTGLSYPSDFLKMPPPPIPSASPQPSGLSPDIIARITLSELFHNPEFRKVHERAEDLQRTVSMLVGEIFDPQCAANHQAPTSKFFSLFVLFG
jgi:hypothetical protein